MSNGSEVNVFYLGAAIIITGLACVIIWYAQVKKEGQKPIESLDIPIPPKVK